MKCAWPAIVLLAGCGGPAPRVERAMAPPPTTVQARTRAVELEFQPEPHFGDLQLLLRDWKRAVLEPSEGWTRDHVEEVVKARIVHLEAEDEALSRLHPGIAHEERSRIRAALALEREKLRALN